AGGRLRVDSRGRLRVDPRRLLGVDAHGRLRREPGALLRRRGRDMGREGRVAAEALDTDLREIASRRLADPLLLRVRQLDLHFVRHFDSSSYARHRGKKEATFRATSAFHEVFLLQLITLTAFSESEAHG